jgi:hypothetical protein
VEGSGPFNQIWANAVIEVCGAIDALPADEVGRRGPPTCWRSCGRDVEEGSERCPWCGAPCPPGGWAKPLISDSGSLVSKFKGWQAIVGGTLERFEEGEFDYIPYNGRGDIMGDFRRGRRT